MALGFYLNAVLDENDIEKVNTFLQEDLDKAGILSVFEPEEEPLHITVIHDNVHKFQPVSTMQLNNVFAELLDYSALNHPTDSSKKSLVILVSSEHCEKRRAEMLGMGWKPTFEEFKPSITVGSVPADTDLSNLKLSLTSYLARLNRETCIPSKEDEYAGGIPLGQ